MTEKGSSGEAIALNAATGDSVVTKTVVKAFTDGNTYKEVTKTTFGKDRSAKPKEEKVKTTWLSSGNFWLVAMLVLIQIIYVTMVYGPIAAFLVELFPTRIRYTSMSLPYHIGNGIFGGLTPLIATRLFDVSKTTTTPHRRKHHHSAHRPQSNIGRRSIPALRGLLDLPLLGFRAIAREDSQRRR